MFFNVIQLPNVRYFSWPSVRFLILKVCFITMMLAERKIRAFRNRGITRTPYMYSGTYLEEKCTTLDFRMATELHEQGRRTQHWFLFSLRSSSTGGPEITCRLLTIRNMFTFLLLNRKGTVRKRKFLFSLELPQEITSYCQYCSRLLQQN